MPEERKAERNYLFKQQDFSTLKQHKEYNKIYQKSSKYHSPYFVLFFAQSQEPKVGFTASKKIGNAVCRNRCKRLLRHIFLETFNNENNIPKGAYVLVAKPAMLKTTYQDLMGEYLKAIHSILKKQR